MSVTRVDSKRYERIVKSGEEHSKDSKSSMEVERMRILTWRKFGSRRIRCEANDNGGRNMPKGISQWCDKSMATAHASEINKKFERKLFIATSSF